MKFSDRIFSVLTYFTFGFFGLIYLIFMLLMGKRIDYSLRFNIYQSIFLSIILTCIGFLYNIALNILSAIPYIGTCAKAFDLIFNQSPLCFSFTISGFIITVIITYLSILALLGKRSFIPVISDIIDANFGG